MIRHADSHIDHGLTAAQVEFLLDLFSERKEFFIASVPLPKDLGTAPCGLWGPDMGDVPIPDGGVSDEYIAERTGSPASVVPRGAVTNEKRGAREYTSRLIDAPARQTDVVTVIAGPHDGYDCVLYMAFGGPLAPKEPNDPTLKDGERAKSEAFWREHALAK